MQELEKILEEIDIKITQSMGRKREGLLEAENIIRKHMNDSKCGNCSRRKWYQIGCKDRKNDGWIPVEDHLPNHLLDCEVTLHNGSRSIARYVESDGCWMDHNDFFSNVIAWKEPSEPYRPERSEK